MGLFDFLKPSQTVNPGESFNATLGDQKLGLLQTAPTAGPQEGFLDRFRKPNEQGLSGADKLFAIGDVLGGNADGAMKYLSGKTQEHKAGQQLEQAKADRAKKNAAFKAAYQGGKFDPAAYLAGIGDEADLGEAFTLATKLAPKAGVDGGTPYTQDPFSGETTWGDRRPMSYSEEQADERAAALEAYREAQLADADERIALSRQREGRIAGGRGGGSGKAAGGHGGAPSRSYDLNEVDW